MYVDHRINRMANGLDVKSKEHEVVCGLSKKENKGGRSWPSATLSSVHPLVSASLWPCRLEPFRLVSPWNFPGKNTAISCHLLLSSDACVSFNLLLTEGP